MSRYYDRSGQPIGLMTWAAMLDGDCDRYGTEAEAIAGHAAMVAKVRA